MFIHGKHPHFAEDLAKVLDNGEVSAEIGRRVEGRAEEADCPRWSGHR